MSVLISTVLKFFAFSFDAIAEIFPPGSCPLGYKESAHVRALPPLNGAVGGIKTDTNSAYCNAIFLEAGLI